MFLDGSELIKFLPKLKNLPRLDISFNPLINEKNFIEILKCIPNIKILKVLRCDGIKKILPFSLNLLPDLKKLVLGNLVTDEELVLTLNSVPQLTFLSIDFPANGVDFLIKALKSARELQILNLDICKTKVNEYDEYYHYDKNIKKLKESVIIQNPNFKAFAFKAHPTFLV